MRTQIYNLNLNVGIVIPPSVKVSQGDINRTIGFRIYEGAKAYIPGSDDTVIITGTKPSGLGFTETCQINGTLITVATTNAMTQESGKIDAELRISNGTYDIGTANFVLYVEPAPHPSGTTDGTTEEARTVLEQCAQYAQEAQEAAEASEGSVREAVDEWLDEHPEATTTIEDGSLELIKIKNVINPDSFTGTDSEKLASAINSLDNGGVILLGRNFTLTSNVIITRNSNRGVVIVKPLNATATIICGAYGFGGTGTSDGRIGGIHFVGIRFIGTGNLVDGYYLIRTYFTNCYFENFNNLVYTSTAHVSNDVSTRYLQTIYFNHCVMRNITDYIIDASTVDSVFTTLYDIRINNTIIEWSHGVIKGGNWQGVYVNENAIEGFDGTAPLFCNIFSCVMGTISNNYFEKNVATTMDLTGYIVGNVFCLEIANNVFIESTKDSGSVILLPIINPSYGFLNVKNNRILVKRGGSAYGISVDSNTTDVLSHINLEGNYCTINDANNKIPNTKTLSQLQVDDLYKIDYVFVQTPATYKVLEIPVVAIAMTSSVIRVPISFPFVAKNTNYNIEINGLNITNVGQVKDSTSVYQKKNGGVVLEVSGTWTAGKTYDGVVALKITFAQNT